MEYRNIFEEFIEACTEDDTDLTVIKNCVDVIDNVKEEVYSQKERLEQCQKILKISNFFSPDDLPEPLLLPHRNFVRTAVVDFKVNDEKKKGNANCYLFSDILLIGIKKSLSRKNLSVEFFMFLSNIDLVEQDSKIKKKI